MQQPSTGAAVDEETLIASLFTVTSQVSLRRLARMLCDLPSLSSAYIVNLVQISNAIVILQLLATELKLAGQPQIVISIAS